MHVKDANVFSLQAYSNFEADVVCHEQVIA